MTTQTQPDLFDVLTGAQATATPALQELPMNWEWAKLEDVAKINAGINMTAEEIASNLEVSFVPMKAVEEETGRLDASDTRKLSDVRKGFTSFREGDVVFAKITPSMENGKIAIARDLQNGIGFGTTELHVLRPEREILANFLFFFLVRKTFRSLAARSMTGTAGQLRVPTEYLCSTFLPIPPLLEQKRIVAKLEEVLSELEAGVKTLKTALEKVKKYRQSVLKAAVQGDLSKAWREAQGGSLEPASVLLERVLLERREKWLLEQQAKGKKNAKYKEALTPNLEGLEALPDGWTWICLEQIANVIDPNPSHRMPTYVESGVPFISIDNFADSDKINYDIGKKIPLERHTELRSNYKINEGDFLFSRIGTIGKTRFLDRFEGFSISHSLSIIQRISTDINARWLCYIASSEPILRQAKKGIQSVGVPDLGVGKMRGFLIPFCSAAEQEFIALELEAKLSAADYLEQSIRANLLRAERLRASVLNMAFSGKLVAQDPSDEPAAVLLERIRALRAAEGGKTRTQKAKIRTVQPKQPSEPVLPLSNVDTEEAARREAWQKAVQSVIQQYDEVLKRLSDA